MVDKPTYKPHPILIRLLAILIFIIVASGVYLLLPSKKDTPVAQLTNQTSTTFAVQTSTPKPETAIPNKNEVIKTSPQIKTPSTSTFSFTLTILDKSYQTSIIPGTSVYDAMKLLEADGSITFVPKEYSGIGKFIEEINSLKNDQQSGKYWIYYINGQPAKIGVSNYIIKPNDIITWKYEKSKF